MSTGINVSKPIKVLDEGIQITSDVSQINFTGGVTATASGNNVTVNVPASGITVGTTPVVSGTDGRVLFQSGGVVQQDAGFIFDSTAKTLTNYGKGALSSNTSFGSLALSGNTTGTNNTALGNGALQFAGTGTNNTALGFYALNNAAQGSFTGTGNIGIGYYAGAYIISGQNNVAIGSTAGGTLTTGSRNTIIGAASLASNSTNNNVVISDGAGNNAIWKDANNFTGIGHNPTSGTLAARLDVRAQGALSTDIAFRVRNSADTADIFSVRGNNDIYLPYPPYYNYNSILLSGTSDSLFRYSYASLGNIAFGQNSSFSTSYDGQISIGLSSSTSSEKSISIGFIASATGTRGIAIGERAKTIGTDSIVIGNTIGTTGYGGVNSIHIGKKGNEGNSIVPDNVFFTYFGDDNPSTVSRQNGSFGLLGQQAMILQNGTGIYGTDTFMGNGGNTLVVRNHPSVPSTNIVDSFQQYSADIAAGNAAPHFRTEAGNIIKLYKETAANLGAGATFTNGSGTVITEDATFGGLTLSQIAKALGNLGLVELTA